MGTLWFNGTFISMGQEHETFEAIYERDGKIIDCGSEHELLEKWKNEILHKKNANGTFVFPGFVDSHLHLIGHGQKLLRLDLSKCNKQEALDQLKILSARDVEWIEALGWNEHNDPNHDTLTIDDLNTISQTRPVFVMRICRHAAYVNQTALQMAGIDESTADPAGGRIERDEDGNLTGVLHDAAVTLVQNCMPPLSRQSVKRALETAIQDCYRHGLTGGHTEDLHYYNGLVETMEIYEETINDRQPFRAHLLIHHEELDAYDYSHYKNKREISPFIELGALKIFADGALGGRTAALSSPYSDDPETTGLLIHTEDKLKNLVESARARQLGVAIHVIGDQALDMALTAIEEAPVVSMRDRLIHVQIARKDLFKRIKQLPLIVDIQPRFVVSDFPWVIERLGQDRLPYSFAWKTLLLNGIPCAGGSDAPIEPVEPLLGIHAAIARKEPGKDGPVYGESEKLTPFEAVSLFTTGSAFAIGKEHERGQIKPGFDADFTILDQNLLIADEKTILNAEVVATIVNGKTVYHNERFEEIGDERIES
ncbi:exoenzyme regulatory protein AepA in lipid-linked oligosaccharide synthesis cluster [Bacillus sp. JCM 19045]|nr:exoenzyme regulatory protein AepA in lipid-linked oligosaccharide synthesis cluster [Bacillus sp. JCM 19045]